MNKSTLLVIKKRVLNALAILTVCTCFAGFCEDSALPINISKTMDYEYSISITEAFEGTKYEAQEINLQDEEDFQENKEDIKEFVINKLEYQVTEIIGQENLKNATASILYTPSTNVERVDGSYNPIDSAKVYTIAEAQDLVKLSQGKHELVLPDDIKNSLTDLLNTEEPFVVGFNASAKTTGPITIGLKVFLDVTAKTEQDL